MHTIVKNTLPGLALLGLVLGGCQPDLDAPKADKGSADFSKYLAVGNSLTAGYSDGGVYLEGQQSSYPALLAQQFKLVGGGDFKQPLFSQAQANGSGYLRLKALVNGVPVTEQVTTNLAIRGLYQPAEVEPIPGVKYTPAPKVLYAKADGNNIQNLGVPGIAVSDIETEKYGSVAGNPYFERLLPGDDNNPADPQREITYLQYVQAQVAAQKPTFFTNWLGNNDVLGFATSGGFGNPITEVPAFKEKYDKMVDALTAQGAKGVLATIPNVSALPFFNTVGGTLKSVLTQKAVPGFVALTGRGNTRKQIATVDIRANGAGRQLVTLTAAPYLGLLGVPGGKYWRDLAASQVRNPATGTVDPVGYQLTLKGLLARTAVDTTMALGTPENPFPSTLILDDTEQAQITAAVTGYNAAISAKAAEKGLALFDANALFTQISANNYYTNGVTNTTAFISGNLFSLDGVHPTPRGYAVVANEMLKVINAKYNASIPLLNPNNYRGILLP